MEKPKHYWKDKELKTLRDVMSCMLEIETEDEAIEFRGSYFDYLVALDRYKRIMDLPKFTKKENDFEIIREIRSLTNSNLGYLIGYFNKEDRTRMFKLFKDISHPIFGRTEPTPTEAFYKGLEFGAKIKNEVKQNDNN